MKKLFTLAIALLAAHLTGNAQDFEFKYQGLPIENGDTLSISAETDIFGELSCETNGAKGKNGLVIAGKDGATVSGKAHLSILQHTFKAVTLQWCMSGSCVPMNKVSEMDKDFSGNVVQVEFDAFTIQKTGFLLASLTATTSNQTSTIYIEFSNGEHANVNSVVSSNTVFDVYDVSGHLILQQANASARSQLRQGIYLMKNGKRTHKVIIH